MGNELGITFGNLFDRFLPEIAKTKLEDSGLIRRQEPPVTERAPRVSTPGQQLPAWALPVAAVAGVAVVLYLVLRK